MKRPYRILPTIIFSLFSGGSLWFACNAVLGDLQLLYGYTDTALGYVTSSVQLGFIVGTLLFAVFTVSDRFSPRTVFLTCSMLGAISNSGMLLSADLHSLLFLRFMTGFFLAGIYPVGMKIAASWYQKGLGRALGFLVGALVLGTAFPHLLNTMGHKVSWTQLVPWTSVVAATGGVALFFFVPDGPYLSKESKFNPRVIVTIFKSANFRSSAMGYFGHMWELYTLWAFIPVFLSRYASYHSVQVNISLWSFCIIAAGTLGCVLGGIISVKTGSGPVAGVQLLISGFCCLVSPLVFYMPKIVFLGFLLVWGITVAGDSPQYSTLNAKTAPQDYVGSALTIVTSIGFSITIISIQLESVLIGILNSNVMFSMLIIGPAFGLWKLRQVLRNPP